MTPEQIAKEVVLRWTYDEKHYGEDNSRLITLISAAIQAERDRASKLVEVLTQVRNCDYCHFCGSNAREALKEWESGE